MDRKAPFFIGPWRVSPELNRIDRDGQTIRLEPKVMHVLLCLADHAGQLVVQDTLLDTVWADTVVGPKVLSRAISELRKAFGDTRQHPRYIETIQKKGYRLIAPIRSEPSIPSPPPQPHRSLLRPAWLALTAFLIGSLGVVWWTLQPPPPPPTPHTATPFTTFQGRETHPALSPDGSRVAFAWQKQGASNTNLYLKQADSETLVQLTDGEFTDLSPSWSPDGAHLVFARHDHDKRALYVVPALGGPARKIYDCTANLTSALSWSPEGQWLAFSDQPAPGSPFSIFALSLQTQTAAPLTHPPPSSVGDLDPAFSPAGDQLAFVRAHVEGNHDVVVAAVHLVDGQLVSADATPYTQDGGFKLGVAWATNALVYASDQGPFGGLWRLDLTSKESRRVALPGSRLLFPSTDHSRLVYAQVQNEVSIWRTALRTLSTEGSVRVVGSTQWDAQPTLSPDRAKLAFASTRSGHPELWLTDADGTSPTQLTHFGNPSVGAPLWSPDGSALLFEVLDQGQTDLYRLTLNMAQPERLTTGVSNERVGSWSVDGNAVYFASNRSGTWELWRLRLADGTLEQITTQGGFAVQAAPNGEGLYYTKAGRAGLWYRPFGEEPERKVHPAPNAQDWGNWVLVPEGFYYLDRLLDASPTLMFYSFSSQTTTPVTSFPKGIVSNQRGLTLSSDGQWVFHAQQDRFDADLMLVEPFR